MTVTISSILAFKNVYNSTNVFFQIVTLQSVSLSFFARLSTGLCEAVTKINSILVRGQWS